MVHRRAGQARELDEHVAARRYARTPHVTGSM
jgi:hypothetical protein